MADEDNVKVSWELDSDDYIKGLKDIDKQTDKTADNTKTETEKINGFWKNVGNRFVITGGDVVNVLKSVVSWFKDAADSAAEYTRAMRGLNEVASAFGQDGGAAQKVAKEIETMSGGMVSATEAAQGLKFLLSSGYSLDEASTMSQALLNIGAFNNVVGDLGQAFVDSTKGIKTGSIELIENIGLTEKLSSVMKRANVSIADGIDITNNREQAQALFNSVMEQGAIFAGNLDEAVQGYDASMARFGLTMDKLMRKIGNKLKPIFSAVADAVSDFLEPLVQDTPKASKQLEPLITEMEKLQTKTELTADEQERLKTVMNDISLLAPQSVISYDNQGNAIINLTKATKSLVDMKIKELEADRARAELENIRAEKELETLQKGLDAKRQDLEWSISNRKEALKYTALTDEQRKEVEKNIELDRARFQEENRETIARETALKSEIALREAQNKKIDETVEGLKKVETMQEYSTTTKKLEDRKADEKVSTDDDTGVSRLSLSQLNKVSNKDLVEFYENKQKEVEIVEETEQQKINKYEQYATIRTAMYNEEQQKQLEAEEQQQIEATNKFVELANERARMEEEARQKELESRADYLAEKAQQDAKEEAAISARIALKKAENQLVMDLVNGEKASLSEYANIIAQEVEITLTSIAVESGIQSLYNLAKGLAFSAVGKVDSAAEAFSASATFAATAAAAGLGATAANAVVGATAAPESNIETPTDDETDVITDTQREAITENQTVYISQSDWKRMAFQNVDAINEALKSGKKLALKG